MAETKTRKTPRREAPPKAPAEKRAEAKGPDHTFDTRQVNRRTMSRADVDAAREVQPRHIAGTRTQAQKLADGEDIGTVKGRKPGLSTSQPLAEGTQLFITGTGFPSREPAVFDIKAKIATGPMARRLSARTDAFGTTQVALHAPLAGDYSVSAKAGGKTAKVAFTVAGGNA